MTKRRRVSQIVLLEGEQLKKLSKLIYKQEVNAIKNNEFRSEYDRKLHLEETREAYLISLSITQLASELSEPKSDAKQEKEQEQEQHIITTFREYLESAVGYAYSCIPNINLRKEYFSRVKTHAAELKAEIIGLDSSESTIEAAQELYNRLQIFKKTTYEAVFERAEKPYRVLSRLTRPSLKKFSLTFRMVKRKTLSEAHVLYDRRFGVTLPLDDNGELLESMVDALANENPTMKNVSRVLKGAGRAIIILTAITMLSDAAMTKGGIGDKAIALGKDVTNFALGYYIGGAVESAVVWGAEAVLGATLIGASALLSFGVGALALGVGFAVAFFVAPCVAKAVDFFFHHITNLFAKKHPAPKEQEETHPPPLSVANVKTYVTPPPDGLTLAIRVAHKGGI